MTAPSAGAAWRGNSPWCHANEDAASLAEKMRVDAGHPRSRTVDHLAPAAETGAAAAGRGVLARRARPRRAGAFPVAHARWKIPPAREARRHFARAAQCDAGDGGPPFLFASRRGPALAAARSVGRGDGAAPRRRLDAHDAIRAAAMGAPDTHAVGKVRAAFPRSADRAAPRQARDRRGVFHVRAVRRQRGGRGGGEPAVVRQVRARSVAARSRGVERAAAEPDQAPPARGRDDLAVRKKRTGAAHGAAARRAWRGAGRDGRGVHAASHRTAAARPALCAPRRIREHDARSRAAADDRAEHRGLPHTRTLTRAAQCGCDPYPRADPRGARIRRLRGISEQQHRGPGGWRDRKTFAGIGAEAVHLRARVRGGNHPAAHAARRRAAPFLRLQSGEQRPRFPRADPRGRSAAPQPECARRRAALATA